MQEDDSGFFALKEVLDDLPETVGPFLRTVLILMHHLAGGKNSCKEPYIQSFPQSHDCTLGWSDSEMKALAGKSQVLSRLLHQYVLHVTVVKLTIHPEG